MKKLLCFLCAALLCVLCACGKTTDGFLSGSTARPAEVTTGALQFSTPADTAPVAVFETDLGTFAAVLYLDQAPIAVENFVRLANQGYYNNITFHRVIGDFLIQSGDATGTGTGGTSFWGGSFPAECSDRLHNYSGALGMAGGAENYSQFYVVDTPAGISKALTGRMTDQGWDDAVIQTYQQAGGAPYLDNIYTVFGQVFYGMDAVDAIGQVKTDSSDRPVTDVMLKSVTITTYAQWTAQHA